MGPQQPWQWQPSVLLRRGKWAQKWKQQMFNPSLSLPEHTVAGHYRRRTGSAGISQTMRLQHETFLNSGQNGWWKGTERGLYKWLAPATIIRSSGGSCIIPLQPSALWFPSSLLSPGVLMCRCLNQAELRGARVPDVWMRDSLFSFDLFIYLCICRSTTVWSIGSARAVFILSHCSGIKVVVTESRDFILFIYLFLWGLLMWEHRKYNLMQCFSVRIWVFSVKAGTSVGGKPSLKPRRKSGSAH